MRHAYQPAEGEAPPPKRAKTFAYTTRKFCRSCNSGWMNEVDEAARPTLAAFAGNKPLELSSADQKALALWATKSILGFFSKEPAGYRFAPHELYRELYETRAPLANGQLWLGANSHGEMGWMGGHTLTLGGPLEGTKGFGASLSFGYGVVHFMYHGSSEWLVRLQYRAHQALRSIWPTQDVVSWPTPLRLQPHDLQPLAEEIHANSRFVSKKPPQ